MGVKGVRQQILGLMDVTNQSYLDFIKGKKKLKQKIEYIFYYSCFNIIFSAHKTE